MMDIIELEIFKHLFAAVAEEMGERLMRSAYSPNIKERRDFSCAIFNNKAEMIAQAAHIPVHLGATPLSVQAIIDAFSPDQMKPGEVFIVNDPFAGGTHLPDITLVMPVFDSSDSVQLDTPAYYVANRAHHADVGGISPGSMPVSKHIDEEGIRIAPSKLTNTLLSDIADATRTPDERRGDLRAQQAALHIGVHRMLELIQSHGASIIRQRADDLIHYTQTMIHRLINDLPDGVYHFEDVMEDDGYGHTHLPIRVKLQINGELASLDFSNSANQTEGPMNAVKAITHSAVNYCFFLLADDAIPANAGVMKPIEVITRPGSIVDAVYPAAVAAGNVETSQRLVDVILGALSQAAPDRIPAASCGSMNNLTIGGIDPRTQQPFAYYETIAGGHGGGPQTPMGDNAASARHVHMTNTLNTPVEALEHAYPFRVTAYALRQIEDDQSLHAGGAGVIREYSFHSPATVTLITERRVTTPYGLQGGQPGAAGQNILITAKGHQQILPAKITREFQAGEKLRMLTPGGGGYGSRLNHSE